MEEEENNSFFKMRELSLCIKIMHMAFFVSLFRVEILTKKIHGSESVDT
jgi:hypothetical protein